MRLLPHQQNVDSLRALACAGLDLLMSSRFELLVDRYGYARAFDRDPAEAVRFDLAQALLDASGSELLPVRPSDLPVVFYKKSPSCLRAAIDCEVPTRGGRSVWISFVVTTTESDFFTLEDICADPGPD